MSWYRDGTINLTNGSVDVIGVGTAFKSEVRFSDILLVDGVLSEIVRIDSDTALKLATPWSGATSTGVPFAVIRNLTNASNYDLMKKIEEFLTDRQRSLDEFADWINAAPVKTGAPDAGKFPLTDRYGVKVFCKSPQQLEYESGIRQDRQVELIAETEGLLAESEARLKAIGDQQAWANQILGYKNDATASASLAQKWADNPENSAVTTGKYSAKHHAIKAAASQADVTTRQADVTAKHSNVITLEQQTQAAKTAAQTSEANAKASEVSADGSAKGAATSASSAAASKTAADAAKAAAESARTAAQTAETNAASSATASASSAAASSASAASAKDWAEKTSGAVTGTQYSAKHHAQQAAASAADATTKQSDVITRQADVITRQADVVARQSNVVSLEASAASSKTAAANSATSAANKAMEAANSATASANSASNALSSEGKAKKWAEGDVGIEVETGAFSAKHHAAKAQESATLAEQAKQVATNMKFQAAANREIAYNARIETQALAEDAKRSKEAAELARDEAVNAAASLTGSLSEFGSVDLSSGSYPTTPKSAGFWKVTVGGVVGGITYGAGDTLVYSKNLNEFYKIDNTESVTSVNGKTGAVELNHQDVGALPANGTALQANKLATARTISISGGATGEGVFDGSGDLNLNVKVADDSHKHTVANVNGLQAALDGKAAASHTHPISNVTGLQAALDAKSSQGHGHAISDVAGLQSALDGKASAGHTHTVGQVAGLGSAAQADIQANPGDQTAGRVLVNGAHGLGVPVTANSPNWPNTSLNNCTGAAQGFYRAVSTTTDLPPGFSTACTILFQIRMSGGNANLGFTQTVMDTSGTRIAVRSSIVSAATNLDTLQWRPWRELHHAENQLPLGTTPDSGRAALGLGSAATRNITISPAAPSGGADGDIWIQY